MQITYIGTIQTPFEDREGMPIQPTGAKDIQGRVIIHPEYEQGLSDIDGFSHLILLYHFHQCKGFNLVITPLWIPNHGGCSPPGRPGVPTP